MIEVELEGVLTVKKDGELVCVVYNDMKKRTQVFTACKDMGVDEIKSLMLQLLSTEKPLAVGEKKNENNLR
jgi:hypothetical protein